MWPFRRSRDPGLDGLSIDELDQRVLAVKDQMAALKEEKAAVAAVRRRKVEEWHRAEAIKRAEAHLPPGLVIVPDPGRIELKGGGD